MDLVRQFPASIEFLFKNARGAGRFQRNLDPGLSQHWVPIGFNRFPPLKNTNMTIHMREVSKKNKNKMRHHVHFHILNTYKYEACFVRTWGWFHFFSASLVAWPKELVGRRRRSFLPCGLVLHWICLQDTFAPWPCGFANNGHDAGILFAILTTTRCN